MASIFKNSGITVPVIDDSTGNMYQASNTEKAVIHALFISNRSEYSIARVNVKVTIDGAKNTNTNPTNFVFVAKNLEVPVGNTLTLDKPINLENNDILRVTADPSPDSSSVDVEAFASILAMTE